MKRTRLNPLPVGMLATLMACSGADAGENAHQVASRVTNGDPDDGHAAVVALLADSGKPTCTGTLIASRVIVTAAHCIATLPTRVAFGADPAAPIATSRVLHARVHPNYDAATLANDIALLSVEAAPAEVAPAKLLGSPPPVESLVLVVGFGATSAMGQGSARKRQGFARVTVVDDTTFTYVAAPSQACGGDSGGPVFVRGGAGDDLVGVTSRGDADCSAYGRNVRVDRYAADFVTPYVLATAPRAAGPGQRCLYPEHCQAGTCTAAADDARLSFCSPGCSQQSDCPQGMSCAAGLCTYPTPSPGALGSACAGASDCVDRLCLAAEANAPTCAIRCLPGAPEACPRAFECRSQGPPAMASYACFSATQAPEPAGCAVAARAGGRSSSRAIVVGLLLLAIVARRARRWRFSEVGAVAQQHAKSRAQMVASKQAKPAMPAEK